MPTKTNTAARLEAAKRFKLLCVKRFLLLFEHRRCGSAAAAINRGIVTSASIDDHRELLKLIWSFSEATDSMSGGDDI